MSRPTFGQAFSAGTIAIIVARAQAAHYRTLLEEGIGPEQAERMTTETFKALLDGGENVFKALSHLLTAVPVIISEITQLMETKVAEDLTNAATKPPR